jgi:Ion channel
MAPVVGLALSCAFLWAILDRFGSIPHVTTGVISEAFICYLVLATAFSQLYCILNHVLNNAFNQPVPTSQTSTFLYSSIITFSTVGYGGMIPANPYVRLMAALEGMVGVFYIAVVVARLVSAFVPRRNYQEGTSEAAASNFD